jgi:hypothetical protein
VTTPLGDGGPTHARTRELLDHVGRNRDLLRDALGEVPPDLRERKPAPDRWSAAEVLEHLAIVEASVAALLDRGLRAAQAAGPLPADPDDAPVVWSIDAAQLLDRERPREAPRRIRPSEGWTAEQAWQALERSRADLRRVVLAADGLATASIRAPHPFLGELSFHQWVAFVGFHEARHAAQVRAVAAALRGAEPGGE